jgi:gas vesicle protein
MNTTNSFAQGLLFGSVVGAGLVLLLAPRAAAEARRTLTDSANSLRDATTDQYGQARRRVVATVDEVVASGAGVRNDVADAIGRGAREVERVAVSVKTVPPAREL